MNIGEQFFGGNSPLTSLTGVGALVSIFLNIAFIIAGLILLFYFVLGGIAMMGSAGNSDPKKAEEAKNTLTSAVIGFVVVFTSFLDSQTPGTSIGHPRPSGYF